MVSVMVMFITVSRMIRSVFHVISVLVLIEGMSFILIFILETMMMMVMSVAMFIGIIHVMVLMSVVYYRIISNYYTGGRGRCFRWFGVGVVKL